MSATQASGPPEVRRPTPLEWVQKNLFATWYDTLITLVFGLFALLALRGALAWLAGAEFEVLRRNLALFMVGPYPRDQLWRVALMFVALTAAVGVATGLVRTSARTRARAAGQFMGRARPLRVLRLTWPLLLVVAVTLALVSTPSPWLVVGAAAVAFALGHFVGGQLPGRAKGWRWLLPAALVVVGWVYLNAVPWGQWGGLLTNVVVTILGIALAFPFGLVLALARRSSFPAFRVLSVTWIELIRGVPLITLLLMGIFVIGFFLPAGLRPGNLTRVLVAIVLFESAYIAEVVRGGLQSVPWGQTEAGQAVGLSPWRVTERIVLPQALRNSIPAMVGQFISLFKDTTLLVVVGIPELLGASGAANAQPDFLGRELHRVTLPFVALIFWAGSFMMSKQAGRLEAKLGVGQR